MLKQSAPVCLSFTSAGLTCMLTRNYCNDTEIVRLIKQQRVALDLVSGRWRGGQHQRRLQITQLETLKRINPTLVVLKQLAKALKVTVGELLQ